MKTRALIALALCVPFPTIGVAFGMIIAPDTVFGKSIFFVSKVWILLLPLVWHVFVEKNRPSFSRSLRGGFGVAAAMGLIISAGIVVAYLVFARQWIDANALKSMAENIGLSDVRVYLAGCLYWILINSVLEEYVWRWFVFKQFERLVPSKLAVVASALSFTIHHVVAMQVYFNWFVTIICSLGIFIGGTLWSWCYMRYRSIWPGYLSHAIVDIAVFGLGYVLIFT